MDSSQFLLILATMYIAPHTNKKAGNWCAAALVALAIVSRIQGS